MSIARQLALLAPLATCFMLAVSPPSARAQAEQGPSKADRGAARDAYDKGTKSFEQGDYVTALDSFVKANALIPSVQAMYWIAQAQDKMGRTDVAIEAYEAITARADFSKLSSDKAATVRERLAALKAAKEPPVSPSSEPADAPPPVVSEPPAPEPPPPPALEPAAPPPPMHTDPLLPRANTAELGISAGALIVSDSHNLVGAGQRHQPFDAPVWEVGLRAGYFPLAWLGAEAEWAHGFGSEAEQNGVGGGSANFDLLRGQVVVQLPKSRLVPFGLLGAGIIHGSSDLNGSDTDLLLQAGAGIKYLATPLFAPRLDLRMNLSQKEGGKLSDGIAAHPEVQLGVAFMLGG